MEKKDEKDEFFIYANDTSKSLFIFRPESIKGDAFSPCCMTTDDVDYEMASGKHPEILEICGMNQESIRIIDAKKMTLKPDLLKTSKVMERVFFNGSIFNKFSMESMDCFAGMPALKHLYLGDIRLMDKRMDALNTLPSLERFDFDAGMLTTEEIAWIVAKYPKLSGKCLCAYNKEDAILNDVRICGFRKPSLNLPQHQKRLDKYVVQFDALVEKYRNES